jgi:hypothetical protein
MLSTETTGHRDQYKKQARVDYANTFFKWHNTSEKKIYCLIRSGRKKMFNNSSNLQKDSEQQEDCKCFCIIEPGFVARKKSMKGTQCTGLRSIGKTITHDRPGRLSRIVI